MTKMAKFNDTECKSPKVYQIWSRAKNDYEDRTNIYPTTNVRYGYTNKSWWLSKKLGREQNFTISYCNKDTVAAHDVDAQGNWDITKTNSSILQFDVCIPDAKEGTSIMLLQMEESKFLTKGQRFLKWAGFNVALPCGILCTFACVCGFIHRKKFAELNARDREQATGEQDVEIGQVKPEAKP